MRSLNVTFLALLPFLAACPPIATPEIGAPEEAPQLQEGRWSFVLSNVESSSRECAQMMGLREGESSAELGARLRFIGESGLLVEVDGLQMAGERSRAGIWAAGVMPMGGGEPEPEPKPPVEIEETDPVDVPAEGCGDGSSGSGGSSTGEQEEGCVDEEEESEEESEEGEDMPEYDEHGSEAPPSSESLLWVGLEADLIATGHLSGDLQLEIEEPGMVCSFTFTLEGEFMGGDDAPPVYEEPMPGGDEPSQPEEGEDSGEAEPSAG